MTDAMQELKKMPIWVLHRRKPKQDGKTDKVLFAANGNATEADEKYRHTWVAYEVAVNDLREIQNALSTNDFLDNDISVLEQDLNLTTELIRACINANTTNSISEEQFNARYAELCTFFEEAEEKLTKLKEERQAREEQAIAIGGMMFAFQELPDLPLKFNQKLWQTAIEKVVVHADGTLTIHFAYKREIFVRT